MTRSESFADFLSRLRAAHGSDSRSSMIDRFLSRYAVPYIEGDQAHFLYRGTARSVAVPGEMNSWDPRNGTMERLTGTNLFHRKETLPIDGRVEYKILADGVWMLDPLNPRTARGGYGENSDLRMPKYVPHPAPSRLPAHQRGSIETVWFASNILDRRLTILVYRPAIRRDRRRIPTVFFTDAGEYLSLGNAASILDGLIARERIRPLLGVFIEPRTNLHNRTSNMRMTDYAASAGFLDFLQYELTPWIERRYQTSRRVGNRLIAGVSMGGLAATHAVLQRPGFLRQCAAQSPAYFQADSEVIRLASSTSAKKRKIYIDTGTINDTDVEARLVAHELREHGATVSFGEYPEGHNWSNWRARIPLWLEYFFPRH